MQTGKQALQSPGQGTVQPGAGTEASPDRILAANTAMQAVSADDLLPLALWRRVLEALDLKSDVWAATAACRALRPLTDVLHGMLDWEALEEYYQGCCDEGKALDDCWRGPDDDPGPLVLEPGATVCIHLGSGCSHGGVMYWLKTNKGVQLAYRCSSVLRIKGPADARGVLRALSASVFAECFREGAHGRLAGLCAQAAAFVPDPNGEHRGRDGLPVRRKVGPIVETEDETFDLRGLLPAPATPEWLRQFEKYITPCMHRDMPPYWPGGAPLSLGSVPMLALDGPDPVEGALTHERINEMYDKGSGLHCYLERVAPARQARGSTLVDLAAANEAVQPIFDPEELDRLWRESRMQKLLSDKPDFAQMTLPQLKDRADQLRRLCQAIKWHPLQQAVQSLVVRSAGPPAPHERVYCVLWGEGCA